MDDPAEDMEIIIRMHRVMRNKKIPYQILYTADPVAWTKVPHSFKRLSKQRVRWHLGLLSALWVHKKLFLNPKYGFFGFLDIPFWVFGESLEPIVELLGWIYIIVSWTQGTLHVEFFYLLMLASFAYTFLFTIACLWVEELTFQRYSSPWSRIKLFFSSLVENFGYRQMTLVWRLVGIGQFLIQFKKFRKEAKKVKEVLKTATGKTP